MVSRQVYEDWDCFKVNDVLELYGILSVEPVPSALSNDERWVFLLFFGVNVILILSLTFRKVRGRSQRTLFLDQIYPLSALVPPFHLSLVRALLRTHIFLKYVRFYETLDSCICHTLNT